jgi:DeoR family transcriptional regulator of aga operon
LASTLIEEQNTIILDSGKSTCVLGRNLRRFKELTVITNDLNIAYEMIQFSNISLNMLGCNISRKSLTLVGTIAEQSLKKFYVDRLFLCVDGIDSGTGLYALNIDEADLKKMMLGASQQVILMADSSQFNRKSFAYICDMDRIHMIVTDGGIPKTDRQIFTNAGIELLISE